LADVVRGRERAFYLYDLEDALARARRVLKSGFSCHYAMKANSHPRLLGEFARLGLGVDVVSLGELQKALSCGFSPDRVIYSGVAKDTRDLEFALQKRIFQINVESFEELQVLGELAKPERPADIALRVNIHLEAPTHKNVQTSKTDSKFGIDVEQLPDVLAWLKDKEQLKLKALAVHIGSQIQDVAVFGKMAERQGQLYREVRASGFELERLDLGGGLGIDYHESGEHDDERLDAYLGTLARSHGTDAKILIEPGRFLVARMGVLLAKVVYVKRTPHKTFAILNSGMNALMRPALYQSFHRIEPLEPRSARETYTVVGPICESTDVFAEGREMPRLERGDWVAIFDTGAYGAVMANTYNETPLPEEWIAVGATWGTT
jgi:diaminopimelate decarboxylase